MALEVAGNAADGIIRVVPDIDVAVAVEIHGIGAETARHELRQAHGTSIGALEREWVELFFAGQQQELAQLLAEEFGARRIVKTQGRQGVDHPVVTRVAAEEGLHTDDRDDHLGRHTVLALGPGQGLFMLAPEIHTTGNARVGDEHGTVLFPWLDALCRARNRIENRLFALHLAEHAHQLLSSEAVVAGHLAHELGHLRRPLIVAGGRMLRHAKDAYQTDPGCTSSRPVTHYLHEILHLNQTCAIHLRWVWIDINTPNADSSVTSDVPP
ncbi:hypothetical protein D3C80_1198560 [compost metagenome]